MSDKSRTNPESYSFSHGGQPVDPGPDHPNQPAERLGTGLATEVIAKTTEGREVAAHPAVDPERFAAATSEQAPAPAPRHEPGSVDDIAHQYKAELELKANAINMVGLIKGELSRLDASEKEAVEKRRAEHAAYSDRRKVLIARRDRAKAIATVHTRAATSIEEITLAEGGSVKELADQREGERAA